VLIIAPFTSAHAVSQDISSIGHIPSKLGSIPFPSPAQCDRVHNVGMRCVSSAQSLPTAFVISPFAPAKAGAGITTPRVDDDHLRVYIPRKTWGVNKDDRFSEKIQREDYDSWEREFLDHANAVTARDIRKNQNDYIFRCDFFELKELIDVKPDTGSCYIRSVCEPFDIEMELDLKKAENWLTHFGLYPYTQIHASGHMNYDEIREVIETVKPKALIPVHTQHPEVFQNFHENVILPEKGVAISI